MDTDYDSYALVCSCQQKNVVFFTVHRRSCTILQREPIPDEEISKRVRHRTFKKKIVSRSVFSPFPLLFIVWHERSKKYCGKNRSASICFGGEGVAFSLSLAPTCQVIIIFTVRKPSFNVLRSTFTFFSSGGERSKGA